MDLANFLAAIVVIGILIYFGIKGSGGGNPPTSGPTPLFGG